MPTVDKIVNNIKDLLGRNEGNKQMYRLLSYLDCLQSNKEYLSKQVRRVRRRYKTGMRFYASVGGQAE